jgi:hypothetical protein
MGALGWRSTKTRLVLALIITRRNQVGDPADTDIA